ncbi:efflux RND transporter permease subunit [Acetobacter thailandicus]|uniref:efflux RND transporter permease subunit n=1 Tax=Acetobacter thailandicus TaxID=1502842 RepID=UPI001BACD247|nr:CusA/CzcA family heavy metal efflux RND transporter [Acetobacter thailandicus]MBS0979545.1 efflux RND transporter permease subunit [Acetobacter thailandicus]
MMAFLSALYGRRWLVTTFLLLIFIAGCLMVRDLPVEAVPDISPQQVLVTVVAPGLATEEIEQLITFPVEASMAGIPDITDLRSVSRSGVSVVYVQFADNTDINLDRTRVEERIQQAKELISVPGISINIGPLTTGLGEIMQLQIKGEGYSLMDLNRLMTWTVAPQLKLVPGVVDVNISGGAEQTFQVTLNQARLLALGVSAGDVFRAVDGNNAASGGGWIEHGAEQQIIAGRGLISSLDDFASVPVRTNADGSAIFLRDIGQVSMGPRTRLGAMTRDGQGEIVTGVVMMQKGASSNATLAAIHAALPAIRQSLPHGVTLEPYYVRSALTSDTISTVKENLITGALLVVGVLIAVTGEWRASLVIASVIPFALVCAMTGMRWFGISANLLSLGAIDFGMIVDSSLVVVENLMTHRARDQKNGQKTPLSAMALSSAAEVLRPVSFGILIIIIVYLPILTLQGIEGKMFRPMAQTVILALLASLFYCLVGIPVIAAMTMKAEGAHRDTLLVSQMRRIYLPLLNWCENRSGLLFSLTAVIFSCSVWVALHLGGEFIPSLDEGMLTVSATRLPSISLPEVLKEVSIEERILRRFPEVTSVVSSTGTSAIPTDPMGLNETDSFIFLKPPSQWTTAHTQEGLVTAMNKALNNELPGMELSWSQPVQMRMDDLLSGVRTQIAVSIYGDNLDTLAHLGDRTVSILKAIPGAADVAAQGEGTVPFIHIDIDRRQAARLNVSQQEILNIVEAIGGHIGRPVTINNALISTQVRYDPAQAGTREQIGHLRVRRSDGKGAVFLSEVAKITVQNGPPRISRDGIRRRLIVQANVRGRDLSSFVKEAQKEIGQKIKLPAGYRITWAGQFQNLRSAMARLEIVVPIALILIFVLLTVALNSARLAGLVFINLPVAATGGIFALAMRGLPFSVSAGIGFIALSGVAVLNGVVLMTAINTLRRSGYAAAQAAFEAAKDRFRPVMATALVASLGFIPMAISTSAGAEVERPLATVVIGGLISSTLLTLLVLPSLYARTMKNRER